MAATQRNKLIVHYVKIIDPHIHLFDVQQGEYDWLKAENPPYWQDKAMINRTFTTNDLVLNAPLTLASFVHIEAGFDNQSPWRELEYLHHSVKHPFKAIGFADLTKAPAAFIDDCQQLASNPSFVGIRHILEDEKPAFLRQPQVISNLAHLASQHWLFELQLPFEDTALVDEAINLLRQVPKLSVVITHAGFKPLSESGQNAWLKNLTRIASLEQVKIKCSGLELLNRHFTLPQLTTLVEEVIACFGANRVMLASNFPLIEFNQPYASYWQTLYQHFSQRPELWRQISYQSAFDFYQF